MPALIETRHRGTVVWLGQVQDRQASLAASATEGLSLEFAGNGGDAHFGLTRPACGRVATQYPAGTEIRNTRQLSVLCADELDRIAAQMGLETLDPAWLGVSVLLRGIADFSHVPPSSRLIFADGTSLVVDMLNRPCHLPDRLIEAAQGSGKGFKAAAAGLRGVTAWVEREGDVRLGDAVCLHIPSQKNWAHS